MENSSRHVDSAAGPPPAADAASKPQSKTSPRSVTSEPEAPLALEAEEADPSRKQLTCIVPAASAESDSGKAQDASLSGITLNRETVTIAGIGLVVAIAASVAGVACIAALVALLTSPLWIPVAILTSPFWFPVSLFTCPLWISFAALAALCAAWALLCGVVIFAVFLFFAWPAKWLPSKSDKSEWFLRKRDEATLAIVKFQAKIVLYSAGVGPLADVALAITERIDLVELQKALSEFDLAEFTDNVRKMDVGEMQVALIAAVRSVVGF